MSENKTSVYDRAYKISVLLAVIFVLVSLAMNYLAGVYATNHASNSVSDILLNILPVYNVTIIFVYGFAAFCVLVVVLMIRDPHKLPYILKSIALFIAIRSIFVTLTHVGPSPSILVDFNDFNFILKRTIFSGDLFFSGHTGLPFLMSLIYWDNKFWRYFFLAVSVIFGASVLLGHLHYSIDVFAAFFIAHGVYRLAQIFFKKDLARFNRAVRADSA